VLEGYVYLTKACVYFTSGTLSIIPVMYYLIVYGTGRLPDWRTNFGIPGSLIMLAQYMLGAIIYTNRLPEKYQKLTEESGQGCLISLVLATRYGIFSL
jgi:predicted membrane channel-forming protein YqfA (hemolysin III family)